MSDRPTIIVWSDYISPYAFVAKAWAYALEADYDLMLDWRPYTLDIASFQGSVEQRDPHHWRRVRYAYMDARRHGWSKAPIVEMLIPSTLDESLAPRGAQFFRALGRLRREEFDAQMLGGVRRGE